MGHMHSTEIGSQGRIDPPKISQEFFDFWPSSPLVSWPLPLLEVYFETLEVLVRYEGRAQ